MDLLYMDYPYTWIKALDYKRSIKPLFYDPLCPMETENTVIIPAKEQMKLNIEESKDVAHIEIIPLSNQEIASIIRPELNLEKFNNFIFPHPKSKNLDDVREKQWERTLKDGREIEWRIVIEPSKTMGCYTTRTRDVYLALTQIFYIKGMPQGSFFTSINEIMRFMCVPMNGKHALIVSEELDRLYKTTISWILSYQTEDSIPQTVKNQHILSVYNYNKLSERADKTKIFEQLCEIDFDPQLKNNLVQKKTAPLNLTTRLGIRSPVNRVLFDMIDMFLAKKTITERSAFKLVEDLNLSATRYKSPSKRKTLLLGFQKALDSKLLSTLRILEIDVLPTADGLDWKCRFRAVVWPDSKTEKITHMTPRNTDSATRYKLADEIAAIIGWKDINHKLYEVYALYYSENAIHRALGEFKEWKRDGDIREKQKAFSAKLHEVVHSMGYEWIKPCPDSCKFRPTTGKYKK